MNTDQSQTPDALRRQIAEVQARDYDAGAKWYQERLLIKLREQLRLAERTPAELAADLRVEEQRILTSLERKKSQMVSSRVRMGRESHAWRTCDRLRGELATVRSDLAKLTAAPGPEPVGAEPAAESQPRRRAR